MLRSTIRTIVTGKASIGLATLALLGGGAALAAPGGSPPDDAPPEFAPAALDTVSPDTTPVEPTTPATAPALDEVPEALEIDLPVEIASDSALYPPASTDTTAEEDDSPGWALGNTATIDGDTQQDRVEAFCAARKGETSENGDGNGVPPFCTTGVEGTTVVPPNEFGQQIAAAARGGEFADDDEGVGPPPGAGRPDSVPSEDAEGERVGPPEGVPTGPPAGVTGRGPGTD